MEESQWGFTKLEPLTMLVKGGNEARPMLSVRVQCGQGVRDVAIALAHSSRSSHSSHSSHGYFSFARGPQQALTLSALGEQEIPPFLYAVTLALSPSGFT